MINYARDFLYQYENNKCISSYDVVMNSGKYSLNNVNNFVLNSGNQYYSP